MEYRVITDLAYTYIGLVTTMTKHYVEEGVPLIFNSSIKVNGIDTSKPVFLDYEFAEKNSNRKHKKDDVVTVHTGDIGVSAVISDDLDGSLGFATIVTRINDFNELLPEYLCAFLNYGGGKEQLYKYSRDARNNLNLTDYNKLIVPVPTIERQREIVDQVIRLKGVIANRNQELSLLDELIKARFVELFGDVRINDKNWNIKPLKDLCDISRGGSPRPIVDFLGGTIPWIKIGDATDGDNIYINSTKEHIIEAGIKKSRYIKSGSLIFANCGVSLGFCRIINFDGCIHDGWLAFQNIDESLDKVFLLMTINQLTDYFRSIAPGGTQPNLNTEIMGNYKQITPPMELQKEYIGFVKQVDKSKVAIQKSLVETQLLFDSLMQKYFG